MDCKIVLDERFLVAIDRANFEDFTVRYETYMLIAPAQDDTDNMTKLRFKALLGFSDDQRKLLQVTDMSLRSCQN